MKTRQFAFHDRVAPNPPDLLQGKTPEEFVTQMFAFKGYSPDQTSLLYEGVVRLGGWEFNFREHLHEYIIQQYDSLSRVFAPNRTAIRRVLRSRTVILAETDRSKKRVL